MPDPAALAGRRIALLVENDFEDSELTGPRDALRAAGAAKQADFDAVVIPGGYAPDKMRMRHAMVDFTRDMYEAGKPVAAICHAPSLLISANAVRGRTLTCWPSIAVDVKNAGGMYVDKPVVEDGNLITSRKPDDIPFFNDAIIRALK